MESSQQVTLGLELEIVATDVEETFSLKSSKETEIFKAIAESITKSTKLETVAHLPGIVVGIEKPAEGVWSITQDATIQEQTSSSDGSPTSVDDRIGFELVSPKLRWAGDWKDQVEEVIGHLNAKYKLKVNTSTGLHVHVGREVADKDAPLALSEIKTLAKMVILFEPVVDTFHHKSRSVIVENEEIRSNRNNPMLKGLSENACFSEIDGAQTIDEILPLLNYDSQERYDGYSDSRSYKVNFTSLKKHGTVEFRQHIATLDITRIRDWIRFVVLFYEASIAFPDAEIATLQPSIETLFSKVVKDESLKASFLKS